MNLQCSKGDRLPFEISSQEYHKLFELNKKQATVLVVGAGFIGVEWVSWVAPDWLLEHAADFGCETSHGTIMSSAVKKLGHELFKSKGNNRSIAIYDPCCNS